MELLFLVKSRIESFNIIEDSDVFISVISVIDLDSVLSINISEFFDFEIFSSDVIVYICFGIKNEIEFFILSFIIMVFDVDEYVVYIDFCLFVILLSYCSINNFELLIFFFAMLENLICYGSVSFSDCNFLMYISG